MEHKGTVRIETERLVLRRFAADDGPAVFRNWTHDPEVTKFLRWPAHDNEGVTQAVLGEWIASYQNPSFYQWAIQLKELGEPIGTISVVGMNERTGMVHIGYCIGRLWWHLGIVTEAFRAIIPFFFDEVGVNRIESQHDPDNPRSGAVMKQCGLHYEGTLRQADWSNRGIVDACVYGLLRTDSTPNPSSRRR